MNYTSENLFFSIIQLKAAYGKLPLGRTCFLSQFNWPSFCSEQLTFYFLSMILYFCVIPPLSKRNEKKKEKQPQISFLAFLKSELYLLATPVLGNINAAVELFVNP